MRIEEEYKKDFNATPKERNVFIFMDGTWNDENRSQKVRSQNTESQPTTAKEY